MNNETKDFMLANGGATSVWRTIYKKITNPNPSSSDYVELWAENNSAMPEPTVAHVMLNSLSNWMSIRTEDYPPSCGCAFGYKKFTEGNIPKRLYVWRGTRGASSGPTPYDYNDLGRYSGFNTTASRTGGTAIPNACANGMFRRSDSIAADAEANNRGDWDVVHNGGNGHWWDRSTASDKTKDSPGSSGSIFGRGFDGSDVGGFGKYPAGTGGNGTNLARGPAATRMDMDILDNLGVLRYLIKGKAYDGTNPDLHADTGAAIIDADAGLLMINGVPAELDTGWISLGGDMYAPEDRLHGSTPFAPLTIILEYR